MLAQDRSDQDGVSEDGNLPYGQKYTAAAGLSVLESCSGTGQKDRETDRHATHFIMRPSLRGQRHNKYH